MKRNKFSLSHYKLLTCDMGYLIPLTHYHVLPGDTFQQSTSCLIRVSPLLAPVMHPVRVRIHHWFVPFRLIWDDFEDFITGGEDGLDATVPPWRNFNFDWTTYESGLFDYLGCPPVDYTGQSIHVSSLPFRAYHMIFNEHYRDQDLVPEVSFLTTSGEDNTTNISALNSVAWEKDYFTTARTTESKGDAITIPFGEDNAPITGLGRASQTYPYTNGAAYETDGSGTVNYANYGVAGTTEPLRVEQDPDNAGYPNIRADMTGLGIDMNDLRLSLALQRYQEARARYGSRYVEYLRYLGVRSSDARLQKPEFLGGGRQTIQFSEVLNHSDTDTGAMAGHGIAAMRTNRFRRFFEEHGLVMTLMSVLPKTIYTQGIHRHMSFEVKEDLYQRELAGIGDQEILNKEVYVEATDPEDTFGFQERYSEYRSMPSGIAGEFRSTLDHWHMARIFASEPALNSTFVTAAPTKRMLASSETDALYVMANHSIQARRPITRRG